MVTMRGINDLGKGVNDGDYGGGVKRFYSSWGNDMEDLEGMAHVDAVSHLAVDRVSGELEYYGVQVSVKALDFERGKYLLEDVIGGVRARQVFQVDILVFGDYESWRAFEEGEVMIWRVGGKLIVRNKEEVNKMSINN